LNGSGPSLRCYSYDCSSVGALINEAGVDFIFGCKFPGFWRLELPLVYVWSPSGVAVFTVWDEVSLPCLLCNIENGIEGSRMAK